MYHKIFAILAIALIVLSACAAPTTGSSPAAATAPTAPAATQASAPTAAPTTAPAATAAVSNTAAVTATATTTSGSTAGAAALTLTLQPDGSSASFKAHEQLANRQLPNDAVGTTANVSGALAIQKDGKILADQSQFVVDVSTLQSDSGMRDNYVRRNVLQTSQYPKATFVPKMADGLPSPLPTSGNVAFKLTGDMTVHGVTKPVTWDVKGTINGNDLTGTATTTVTFEDFGMTPPKTMAVLKVDDSLLLTLNFHLSAGAAPTSAG